MADDPTGDASQSSQQSHQEHETQLWRMRWFVLIVASIGFLASTGASIAIYILTKNPLPFAVPSTIMIAMRPIIHFLFTQDGHEHNKKRVPHRIASNITSLPRRPES